MTYPSLAPGWTAQQATAAGVPSVPQQVTSAAFDGGAVVYWNHPGDHLTASYTATALIAGVAQPQTAVVNGSQRQAVITGLTNSTAYTFTVHAANSFGSSPESPQSGANTPLANLIFGDDFGGSVLSPCWRTVARDGDQSAPETQFWLPSQVTLDGSSHVLLTAAASSYTAPTYNDANPPLYAGGAVVTRANISGMIQWAWPGALATGSGSAQAVSQFGAPGFNFTYGKIQVSAQVPNVSGGWAAVWMLGAQCEQTTLYNPDNVGTCNWPSTGSEEIDIAEYTGAGSPTTYTWTGNFNGGAVAGPTSTPVTNPSTTFNTYEADWSSGTISWFTNGVAVSGTQPYSNAAVPATPMFLILANAMRGAVTLTQPVLSVDWVRVFHN